MQIKYLHNPVSGGYHLFSNISCDLVMARFIGDRINALLNQADYIDLAPYGLFKSLRLPGCPKVGLDGTVNANSRYNLPEGAELHQYLVTNTIGCVHIPTPLHIQQSFPIDAVLQHGTQQV